MPPIYYKDSWIAFSEKRLPLEICEEEIELYRQNLRRRTVSNTTEGSWRGYEEERMNLPQTIEKSSTWLQFDESNKC